MGEMFSEIDLNQQQRLKCAFERPGPAQPGQGYFQRCTAAPSSAACHVHGGKLAFSRTPAVFGPARSTTREQLRQKGPDRGRFLPLRSLE